MKKNLLVIPVLFFLFAFSAPPKIAKLKFTKKYKTNVPEPSDIAYGKDNTIFIVSDQGVLYQVDEAGKIVKTASEQGLDYEGVWADENFVYVADERARRIKVFDYDLNLVRQNEVSYHGGMNLGYEGITYNEAKKCFLIATEKTPMWFFELNNDLVKINEKKMKIASDVSGLCFHDNFLYIVSDEDQTVMKLNPNDYSVIQKWQIPVTNPEGIAFDKQGNLIIVSDFEQTIFQFSLPETN